MKSDRYHKLRLANHVLHPETLMLGYGYDPLLSEGAVKPPVFLTSTFVFRSAEEGRLLTKLLIEGRDERDQCAALLLHLAQMAPLVLAVYSGGKSLHGWFYCDGRAEQTLEQFMQYAVSLGADKASWTSSQFTRMPDGLRKGQRQTVYFFNPSLLK